jgi:AcrR family transcriptional regulator
MTDPGAGTKERILQAAYELFYRKGYVRIGVDAIAARAGVTKRTLYYHFRSKDDLLGAALAFHHKLAMERIERWGARLPRDPNGFLDTLFADLTRWALQPRWEGAGFTRLVMELADLPGHPARAVAREHKATVQAWIARELAARDVSDAAGKAGQLQLILEGCFALLLIHGDDTYIGEAAATARLVIAQERRPAA